MSSENINAQNGVRQGLKFRWVYILLPLIFLLISVAITAWFYHLLPEAVGYRFLPDGSADGFAGRTTIILWALIPQAALTLVAAAIPWSIIRLVAKETNFEKEAVNPQTILLFIGNMIALPQIILCFAMLDIFSYNAYQVHWLPLWVSILIVAGGGAVILGVYFLRFVMRIWKAKKE